MSKKNEYTISCDANLKAAAKKKNYIELNYRSPQNRNVDLHFEAPIFYHDFVPRVKDLIDLSAFLYAAEIKFSLIRNDEKKENISKLCHFHIPVRDYNFWKQSEIKSTLEELLFFLTGDDYRFNFFRLNEPKDNNRTSSRDKRIVTFLSGGIDSAAGIIHLLENSPGTKLLLLSHQAGLSGSAATQNSLSHKIEELYPDQCLQATFRGGLLYHHAFEKDFSTRSILYNSVAFAASLQYEQDYYYLYENGISAINFRGVSTYDTSAGRSCHPKTLFLLEKIFYNIIENDFYIEQPFVLKTKTEIIREMVSVGRSDLLDLTVSCDRRLPIPPEYTHCGMCPPCLSRRMMLTAAGIWHQHKDSFRIDLVEEDDISHDQKVMLEIMIMELIIFEMHSLDAFCRRSKEDLYATEEYIFKEDLFSCMTEFIYDLCRRHFQDLKNALSNIWVEYTAPWSSRKRAEFFSILDDCYNYKKTVQSGKLADPETKYVSSLAGSNPVSELEKVPPKNLKAVVIEECRELIKLKEISDKTKYKILAEKTTDILSAKYDLTEANKRSIALYFRSGAVHIIKVKGELLVLKNNKKSSLVA